MREARARQRALGGHGNPYARNQSNSLTLYEVGMIFKWFNKQNSTAALEARVSELESQRKRINLEWDETFEKFRLLYARLSKRVRQLDQAPSQAEDTQPGETTEANGKALGGLSPRQSEVQARILARRNRTGVQ